MTDLPFNLVLGSHTNYINEPSTIKKIIMKKATLLLPVLFFIAQLLVQAQTDVTNQYLKNPGFDLNCNFLATDSAFTIPTIDKGGRIYDVYGWTKPDIEDWTASATFEYGFPGIFNGQDVPATAKDTSVYGDGHGALGLTIGWGASIAYTQEVTLPAGVYTLKYNAYNSHPSSDLGSSTCGWLPNAGDTILSTALTSYPSLQWVEDEIEFMIKGQSSGKIQIGYASVEGSSSNNAHVFYDDIQLFQTPLSDDATLKTLEAEGYELDPVFDPSNTYYGIKVPYGTSSISLSAIANNQYAEISYRYGIDSEESTDGLIPFSNIGVDVQIIVTAAAGTEMTYYLNVDVEDGTKDSTLQDIELSISAIEPAFSKEVKNYTAIVPQGSTTVDVTGIPTFEGASVAGDGTLTLVDGTVSTTITVTSQDGKASESYTLEINEADGKNYALKLAGENGPDSHVLLTGNNINTLPFTIEMWIKPEGDQASNAGLFHRKGLGLQYASSWQGSNLIRFLANDKEGGQYGGPAVSSTVVPNVWHHVAVVMTDSTRTVYVDDNAFVENAGAYTFSAMDFSAGNLFLGWDDKDNARVYKGLMDEVRVWSDALSPETLKSNKYKVLNGNEEHLLAYYNFDVNSSTSAIDLTPTAAHGIIVGGSCTKSFPRVELETLEIEGATLYPAFSNNVTDYKVVLPVGTSEITVNAISTDAETSISGDGTIAVAGKDSIVITASNGGDTKDYVIHYNVDVALTLTHSYTFIDGTAKDIVGNADGTLYGEGYIEEGVYYADSLGSYIAFPGDSIEINTYPSLTLELFINDTEVNNSSPNTMIAYLGANSGNNGVDGLFFSEKDRENGCKASIFCNNYKDPWTTESGVAGPIIAEDGNTHHIVITVSNDSIALYVDNRTITTSELLEDNKIFNMSNALAYLCKSGYANDNTWLGSILEYNIYKGAMNRATVEYNYTKQMTAAGVLNDNTTDATLSEIIVDTAAIAGFNPTYMEYTVEVPYGSTTVPTITATAKVEGAVATVTKAESIGEATTIVVVSKDGNYSNTYTINLVEAPNPADATLNDLLVDGTTISNFAPETLKYSIKVDAGAAVPTITATATNPKAWITITAAKTLSDTTFIVVMPEDSSATMTYEVTFEEAAALDQTKRANISVVPTVSNGQFTVKTDGSLSTITVYSLSGVVVKQLISEERETTFSLDKSQMYLVSVTNNRERQIFRILKK